MIKIIFAIGVIVFLFGIVMWLRTLIKDKSDARVRNLLLWLLTIQTANVIVAVTTLIER